jgi:hypothetical protein
MCHLSNLQTEILLIHHTGSRRIYHAILQYRALSTLHVIPV